MRKIILSIMTIFACTSMLMLSSCKSGSSEKKAESKEMSAEKGKEYTSKYICPMHCEGSGSETEGQCPVCGMDYVLNDEYKNTGHDHDHDNHQHDHEGHDHSNEDHSDHSHG
jgi:predicted nucleic acid binding AN1-type Zn finger protein